ncbi:MAG: hypothetical protein WDN49_07955 [Acetobacteraceae bacterium]
MRRGVRALAQCTANGGTDCQIYAENLDVVWPGRQSHTPRHHRR